MLVSRWHIRRKSRPGERHKTLCGLLVSNRTRPRECLVNESGAHEFKKPTIVSPRKLWNAPLIYRCSKCLTAAFGWGATTAAWLQSDERKNYETTRRSYASGRMCLTTEEIQARLKRAEAAARLDKSISRA